MDWIILVLIATLLWAIMSVIHKFIRLEYIDNTIGYLIFITPTALFVGILLFFEPLTLLSLKKALIVIFTGFLTLIGGYFYWEAIHREEISRVIILFGIMPLFVLTLSTIFLKEVLTINQYIAFALIFAGSILISYKKVDEKIKLSTGAVFVLISAFFFSVHKVVLKSISTINLTTMMIYREAGYVIAILLILLFYKKSRTYTKDIIKKLNLKRTAIIYASEVIGITGLFFSYLAIQRGPVSLISVLEGFQPIFVLIFAMTLPYIFPRIKKEVINKKTITIKIISIILMLSGLYLISI